MYQNDVTGFAELGVNLSATSHSSRRRVFIWRETLPVHFPGTGAFPGKIANYSCAPLPRGKPWHGWRQRHNFVADAAMRGRVASTVREALVDNGAGVKCKDLPPHVYLYRANLSEGVMVRFWRRHNVTYLPRHATHGADAVSGIVHWWPVWDLFSPFHMLHPSTKDCTHYCFVPTLWDAAIERLGLIFEDALAKHQKGEPVAGTTRAACLCRLPKSTRPLPQCRSVAP